MVHKTRKGANGEPFRTSVSPKAVPHFAGMGWEQEAAPPVEAKGKGPKKDDKKPVVAEKPAAAEKIESGGEAGDQ